ncbi:hypothetical protein HA402_003461 [Bradysia odoriphaga]|nr:hypothetical protein HA402_003461 [Bradysia odoriphaga]
MAVFWTTEVIPLAITSLMPIGLFPMLGITVKVAREIISISTCISILLNQSTADICKLYGHEAVFTFLASLIIASSKEAFSLRKRIALKILANVKGGCASLPGTPTNLVFKGIFEAYFSSERKIDFLIFFLYSGPIVLLNTFLTWIWLQIVFMGLLRPKSDDAVALLVTEEAAIAIKEYIAQKHIEMGEINAKEIRIAVVFVMFHLVLFSRPYWAVVLTKLEIENATPMILFVILIFILPTRWNCCKCCSKSSDDNHPDASFLEWTCIRRKVPWGLIFLLGAGVALASSLKELSIKDKIDQLIGENIQLSPLAISFIVCVICQIFTEFLSNTAAANIVLPVLAAFCMHKKFEGHAIDVMFPAALSLSMAFHSSIGTPGNAYVADLINIPAKELFYCGIGPSIITLLTCWSTFPTYGNYVYGHIKMPNGTAT